MADLQTTLMSAAIAGAATAAAGYLVHMVKKDYPGGSRQDLMELFVLGAAGNVLATYTLPLLTRL